MPEPLPSSLPGRDVPRGDRGGSLPISVAPSVNQTLQSRQAYLRAMRTAGRFFEAEQLAFAWDIEVPRDLKVCEGCAS